MVNTKEFLALILRNIPSWMDIKKRSTKSVGGQFLSSVSSEQNEVNEAFENFKASHFLRSYFNKEEAVISRLGISQIGDSTVESIDNISVNFTMDPSLFVSAPDDYVLYQDGNLFISLNNIPESKTIDYSTRLGRYSAPIEEHDIWNIFDEFALFSGLERYDGETNQELAERCYASFKRPPNSTEKGIKNTIINALANKNLYLNEKEIEIDTPTEEAMLSNNDKGNSLYDTLSSINKDIYRTKTWNISLWQHDFKESKYIPNQWDAKPKAGIYQSGTGQMDDLKITSMKNIANESEYTDVYVTPYRASKIKIDDYIRKQNLRKTIPLQLKQYSDELKIEDVEYKITASELKKIDASSIYLKACQHNKGTTDCYLSSILVDQGELTKQVRNTLDDNSEYALKFYARQAYDEMLIHEAKLINGSTSSSLLSPNSSFRVHQGIFQNTDVKIHMSNTAGLYSYDNIVNASMGGLTLAGTAVKGTACLDVTGISGMPIIMKVNAQQSEITADNHYVKYRGFELSRSEETLSSTGNSGEHVIEIDIDATSLSFEIDQNPNRIEQGVVNVQFFVDDQIYSSGTGLFSSKPIVSYSSNDNSLHKIHVVITKFGSYPVSISHIKAARYNIRTRLERGNLIYTAFYTKLPPDTSGKINYLYIDIESYSEHSPVIEYIHIGPSVSEACYEVTGIRTSKNNKLSIGTNCRVELLKYNPGTSSYVLVNSDYLTADNYVNNTNDTIAAIIDVSNYTSITDSSKDIKITAYRGNKATCIYIHPGENIDRISITGEAFVVKERKNVFNAICEDFDDSVYVANNAPGFIIKKSNGTSFLKNISRKDITSDADSYEYEGLPEGITGHFTINSISNVSAIRKDLDREFENTYLRTESNKIYIATNQASMYQSYLDDVRMINTFSPYLDMTKEMFYRLNKNNNGITSMFVKNRSGKIVKEDWCVNSDYMHVRLEKNIDYDAESNYKIELSTTIEEPFIISNYIPLKKIYGDHELACYEVTAPDDMTIDYKIETYRESLYIKEDLFNKLKYSNVESIVGVYLNGSTPIKTSEYSLLKNAGIVTWNSDTYVGAPVEIVYEYKSPNGLEYKSLSSLYDLISYSTDAYEAMTDKPILYSNCIDGSSFEVLVNDEVPGKIVARCSNEGFDLSINNNSIRVIKVEDTHSLAIHSGYYYDNNDEYYLFENDLQVEANRFDHVNLYRVKHVGDTLRGIQDSSNFLKDTMFTNGDHFEELCNIDCSEASYRINEVSGLKSIGACESYQMWKDFDMDISIVPGYNGNGIYFSPKSNGAYAVLEITKAMPKDSDTKISLIADSTLKVRLASEILVDNESMVKSVFIEPLMDMENGEENERLAILPADRYENNKKYYLLVTGSGALDDIIVCNDSVDIKTAHRKNIDRLHFNIVETIKDNYERPLVFDLENNLLTSTDINNDGLIRTSTSVDWGLTQAAILTDKFSKFSINNVELIREAFRTGSVPGTVLSPIFTVRNSKSAGSIYLKINDAIIDGMKNFNVKIYSMENSSGKNKVLLKTQKKTNMVQLPVASLNSYLQVEVEMPEYRVINSMELYIKYIETESVTPKISYFSSGELTTKIYDMIVMGNYAPLRLVGNIKNVDYVNFYVRGRRTLDDDDQWTQWYKYKLDSEMNVIDTEPHVFNEYKYFQFKIELNSTEAEIRIEEIILGTV